MTVSLVLLPGLIVALLVKARSLSVGSAVVAAFFGFCLATSTLAGLAHKVIDALVQAFGGIQL